MENLTPTNIALLFCGIVIKFLYAVKKQQKLGLPFQIGFFLKDEGVNFLITLVAGFASLIMAQDILRLVGVQAQNGCLFYSIHAFVSGIVPMFFIDKVLKLYKIDLD